MLLRTFFSLGIHSEQGSGYIYLVSKKKEKHIKINMPAGKSATAPKGNKSAGATKSKTSQPMNKLSAVMKKKPAGPAKTAMKKV